MLLIENKTEFFPEDFFDYSLDKQLKHLSEIKGLIAEDIEFKDEMAINIVETIRAMKTIQDKKIIQSHYKKEIY